MREYTPKEIDKMISEKNELYLYLYTPFCGSCQIAGKMITDVSNLLPSLNWGKSNLNFMPNFAQTWKIESVPCLVVFQNEKLVKKIYTFHSAPFLYKTIKEIANENKDNE